MATKVQGHTLILLILIHRPTITEQRQLATVQYLLLELCREPVLRQLLRDNVLQDITGCLHQEAKPAGAWLMQERMLAEADTAAMLPMAILIILLRQPPEDIIVAVSLGILSGNDALTALVREATHGMDPNAYHSLLQVIPEVIMAEEAHTSTVALQVTIGMAASV